MGFDATVEIWDENDTVLQSLSLGIGEDKWILWQGSNSRLSDQPCCVHPETQVSTGNGMMAIKRLRSGDSIINHEGNYLRIEKNIKCVPTKEFIKIEAGALGKDLPYRDLLIRPGHPILLNGKETDPKKLLRKNPKISLVKLDRSADVWTICTAKRDFVLMEGIPVCTWETEDWERYIREKPSIVFWEY